MTKGTPGDEVDWALITAAQLKFAVPYIFPHKACVQNYQLRLAQSSLISSKVSKTYILMCHYYHSLSLDAIIMVSKNCPITGEHNFGFKRLYFKIGGVKFFLNIEF